MAVLERTIQEASYMFIHTNKPAKSSTLMASSMAFAFISGTGLDILIETYNIALNPEVIREQFSMRFHVEI